MPTTNQYEATFILGEDSTPEQALAKATALSKVITGFGGSVSKQENWGKRELAYPIKRNRAGVYTTLWFELPAAQITNLEKQLRFDESIIRSLITLAYTTAQAGSLYPVVEEVAEKPARAGNKRTTEVTEATSAEAELRRSTGTTTARTKKAEKAEKLTPEEEAVESEEERLQKLDAALGDILKDEA